MQHTKIKINLYHTQSKGMKIKTPLGLRIPVMANSDSGGSRTAVRMMANKSRSEATLFF